MDIISIAASLAIPSIATGVFYKFVVKGLLARQKADYAKQLEEQRSEHSKALEKFKQEGQVELSNRRANHELSVAALEKRLEVHQKAYSFWVDIKTHDEHNAKDTYNECFDFLKGNSIYLTPCAREAFTLSMDLMSSRFVAFKNQDEMMVKTLSQKLEGQGSIIQKALNLPDINVWKDK